MAVIDNLLHRSKSHEHLERGITRREIVFAALHAPRRVAKTPQRYDETDDRDCVIAQLGFYRSCQRKFSDYGGPSLLPIPPIIMGLSVGMNLGPSNSRSVSQEK